MIKKITLLLFMSCITTAFAQQVEEEFVTNNSKTNSVTEANTEKPNTDSQPGTTTTAVENYRPSESISEDLSVSFPVDI